MAEERAHARFGGSNAYQCTNCPGSMFLVEQLPPEPPREEAVEGTVAHDLGDVLVEDWLRNRLEGTDPEIRAQAMSHDPDMYAHIIGYRDAIWKHVLHESITDKAYGIEDRFALNEELQMFGFIDFWTAYRDERAKRVISIIDLKYGFLPVRVAESYQIPFYLCCLRAELRRNGKDIDRAYGAIYQPRCPVKEPFQQIMYTAKQLDSWEKRFNKAAEQVFVKRKPKFKVGPWCTYCKAQGICVAKKLATDKEIAYKLAMHDNSPLPAVPNLPIDMVAEILAKEDAVVEFIKAVKAFAIRELQRGTKIPGVKLVQNAGRREWVENDAAVESLLKSLNVEPYKKKLIGLGEAEEGISQAVGITKKDAKNLLNGVIQMKPGSLSLVDENDPRPAVQSVQELLTSTP